MSVVRALIRAGSYHDSVVLMQLQRSLSGLPGVEEAGVVMATAANQEMLAASGLLAVEAQGARADDLLIAVRAVSDEAATAALREAEALLVVRRPADDPSELGDPTLSGVEGSYRPRSLAAALAARPQARWVLVSVPGRYAAAVAREALQAGRNVFLYSDNVSLDDEAALKALAAAAGLLVLGPDCGTARVGGIGLGFANRVRAGSIGLIGASGTGLQTIMSRVHALGRGVRAALGTGGRDLATEIGGVTALQALALLASDPETAVIVFVSKPPAPRVATRILAAASACGKPVVVHLLGQAAPGPRVGNLHFARGLDDAAEIACALDVALNAVRATQSAAESERGAESATSAAQPADGAETTVSGADSAAAGILDAAVAPLPVGAGFKPALVRESSARSAHATAADIRGDVAGRPGHLRALFSGGTLAYEALLGLRPFLGPIWSNAPIVAAERLVDPHHSRDHTLLDLGADEFTQGRPHPMLDPALVAERLAREAAAPGVAVVLLDVVLGDGAHPDPAALLAPAIAAARTARGLAVVALVIGTDEDPQNAAVQSDRLVASGAIVVRSMAQAIEAVLAVIRPGEAADGAGQRLAMAGVAGLGVARSVAVSEAAVDAPADASTDELAAALAPPLRAINVGVESFAAALTAQGAEVLHVDWRPPAGGDEKLQAILARMRGGEGLRVRP